MSDAEKLAERIAIALQVGNDMDATYSVNRVQHDEIVITAAIAPILARNAAMEAALRECRPCVEFCMRDYKSIVHERNLYAALLHRIDQLTAKGAGQ